MAGLEYEAVPQDIMAVVEEVVGSYIHHRSLFSPLKFIQIKDIQNKWNGKWVSKTWFCILKIS